MSSKINNNILLVTITPSYETRLQVALYYLKAYVEKFLNVQQQHARLDVAVFSEDDRNASIVRKVLAKDPAMIGMSCYVWNIKKSLEIVRAVKELRPDITIVLGGPEVTPRAHELLEKNPSVAVIVRGEGERPFLELVQWFLLKTRDLGSILGISYRQEERILSNPDVPPFTDLDMIPSPFLNGHVPFSNNLIVLFETMRGCPYRCRYCYDNKGYKKVRYFSLSRIEEELKLILASKPMAVFIIDPTFNADGAHAKAVLRCFNKYNQGSLLRITIKAELLDDEMIALMAQANLCMAEVGVQSAHPGTLKAINRTMSVSLFSKNVRKLRSARIPFELQLIGLLPVSTYADLKGSLDWAAQFHPSRLPMFKLMLLPGTYLWAHAGSWGIQHDLQPPYAVRSTHAMPPADVRKMDDLMRALDILYNKYDLQRTLFALRDILKVSLSTVLEEWIEWERVFYEKQPDLKEKMGEEGSGRFLSDLPDFLKAISRKFGNKKACAIIMPVLKEEVLGAIFHLEKLKHADAGHGRRGKGVLDGQEKIQTCCKKDQGKA